MPSELAPDLVPPSRAWAVLATVGIFSRIVIVSLLVSATGLINSTVPDWEARAAKGDDVGGFVAIAVAGGAVWALLSLILAASCFLIWLYRAVRLAQAFVPPISTPLGAVVCWFIPFLNLVKPYGVLQSLYRVSRAADGESRDDWVSRWPTVFPVWWLTYLVAMIATNLFMRAWSDGHFTNPSTTLGIVAVTLGLVAAVCATAIVWSIQINQEALFAAELRERADAERHFQPPPV